MTKNEAIEFLRQVCAERIYSIAASNSPASASALAFRCEQAFEALTEEVKENDD